MNEVLAYLNASLTGLKIARLGPKSVEKLNRAGIHSLWDLVCFLPRDYLDFSQKYTIPQTPLEVPVQVSGRILSGQAHATQQKKIPLYEMLIDDGFGTLRVLFFNQPYLAKTLKKDSTVSVQGKITFDRLGRVMINPKWRFANPETDVAPGILPIYREIGGLRSEQIADWIQQAIRRIPDGSPRWFEGDLDMRLSLERLHFPRSPEDLEWIRKGEDPGQIHLIIEEFLCFSRSLKRLAQVGNLHKPDLEWANSWRTAFQKALPFELTQDQLSTVQGLEQRLLAKQRLFALIQGDVGSGKTAMALYLAFGFAQAGKQSTLMCPTTILANQHYETAHILLAPLGVRVGLLTSKMEDRQIKATLLATEKGEIDFLIGTHRLIQDDVNWPDLQMVVIDEQHRFGVEQRGKLLGKGQQPHYVALSATPIPRSLALTLYAGFDIFQIKQKPPGRVPVKTILKRNSNRDQVIEFALKRMAVNESVFWVFPWIEGEEDERSILHMFDQFKKGPFKHTPISLIHGQMKADEIEDNLQAFRAGQFHMLMATTIVEVGVDIPQATVMVIESANQFGLSQLHQLRGRVGRNNRPGFCFMIADTDIGTQTLTRLRQFESTEDGFEIALTDLKQRGFGSLIGLTQAGVPRFLFGDPWQHPDHLTRSREILEALTPDQKDTLAQWSTLYEKTHREDERDATRKR